MSIGDQTVLYIGGMVILIIMLGFMMVLINTSISRRNEYRKRQESLENKMEMNEMRNFLEKQLFEINYKLMANDSKWKDVNHLLISSQQTMQQDRLSNQDNNFINDLGINKEEIKVEKDLVFVLTPFNKDMEDTYMVIRQTCQRMNLKCSRGDEKYLPGKDLMPQIVKMMLRANIIVANIDGRNPNVYYELGIAHALNKKTILVSKAIDNVSFDLQSKNILLYENDFDFQEKLKDALIRIVVAS